MSGAFSPLPPLTLQQAEDVLHRIPANIHRELWAAIAAALHGEFGDVAFDAFDRWSAAGDTYDSIENKMATSVINTDMIDRWKYPRNREYPCGCEYP